MKRIAAILAIMFAVSAPAWTQDGNRQKIVHMAAVRIAERIQVPEQDKDAFVGTYQAYRKDLATLMKKRLPAAGGSEDEIEAKILSDFQISEDILRIRKRYYTEFRKILRPGQIQQMYNIEKEQAGKR